MLLPARKALAQSPGVVGGFTYAKINVSGNETLNSAFREKWHPTLGGFVAFDVRDELSIDVEAMWSVQGGRFRYTQPQTVSTRNIHEDFRLTYLSVPVLVRWAPPQDSSAPWLRVFGGPYTAFLLDAESEDDRQRVQDLSEVFNTLDLGWVAGFGVNLAGIDFDIRYGGSFTNIADQKDLGIGVIVDVDRVRYRNRLFTFVARYRF